MRHPNLLAGETLPGLPRQERSAAKRARILAAAEQLFSEHGYERVAIEDVARSARVATGGVYLHFSSKKQLLKSLMADLVASLAAIELRIQGEGDNPREALRRLLGSAPYAHLPGMGDGAYTTARFITQFEAGKYLEAVTTVGEGAAWKPLYHEIGPCSAAHIAPYCG